MEICSGCILYLLCSYLIRVHFAAMSNKCYKVTMETEQTGLTWDEALTACRNGPGFLPDLASVANSDEQGTYKNIQK